MINIESIVEKFEQTLLSVDRPAARNILVESGQHLGNIEMLEKIITPTLERIGEKWEAGNAALSQVYMGGIICEELINTFLPQQHEFKNNHPPIAIVTFEDSHVLGKRIVLSILKANGFDVLDYGHGVQTDELINMAKNDGIKVLLISTLMLPSALHIKNVREELERSGRAVKIIVGGAPFRFDETLWEKVGADAMGRTATEAVEIIQNMLEDIS